MNSLCRLCSEESRWLKSIYSFAKGRLISDLITILIPIKLEACDDLPKNICDDCLEIVLTCQELREKAVKRDCRLRSRNIPKRKSRVDDQDRLVFVKVENEAEMSDRDSSNIVNHEESSNDSDEREMSKRKKLKKKKSSPLKPHSSGMTTNKRRLETSNEFGSFHKLSRLDEDSDDVDLTQLEMKIKKQNAAVLKKLATMKDDTQQKLQDPFDTSQNFIPPSPVVNDEEHSESDQPLTTLIKTTETNDVCQSSSDILTMSRNMFKVQNELLHELKRLKDEKEQIYLPPQKIKNKNRLIEFENILMKHNNHPTKESSLMYKNLVKHYSKKICNRNSRTSPSIGLPRSFLELFVDGDFLLKLGWSDHEGRIPFSLCKGHIGLTVEIVNKHTPGIFKNADHASKHLQTVFKRIHEKKRPSTVSLSFTTE